MMLLVDVGNTRAKWCTLAEGKLSQSGSVLHRGVPAAGWVSELPAGGSRYERILVSNVAGSGVARELDAWALERHGVRPEYLRATRQAGGVTNAYDNPESLGADRWLGMIGAWRRAQAPLICIAAGTAMTVDAVDGLGRHLGGLIVPGRDLMIDSLLRRTSDISRAASLAPPVEDGMLGRNTAAAIELGAVHALAALAARTVERVGEIVGSRPHVFLGGGDASRIESVLGMQAELLPELVLEGLAVMAEEH